MNNERKHGWSASQVSVFAKRFARSSAAKAWTWMVPEVREALVRAFTLDIALSVDRDGRNAVTVAEVQELANDVISALAARHRMAIGEKGHDSNLDGGE